MREGEGQDTRSGAGGKAERRLSPPPSSARNCLQVRARACVFAHRLSVCVCACGTCVWGCGWVGGCVSSRHSLYARALVCVCV